MDLDLGLELFPGHRGGARSRAVEVLPPLPDIHPLYLPPPCHPPEGASDADRVSFLRRTYYSMRRVYFRIPAVPPKPTPKESEKVLAFADVLRDAKVPPADFVLYSLRRHAHGCGPRCPVPPMSWVYSIARRAEVVWLTGVESETRPVVWLHPFHRELIARWNRARIAVDDTPPGTSVEVLQDIVANTLGNWDEAVTRVRGACLVSARNVRAGLRTGEWLWPPVTL